MPSYHEGMSNVNLEASATGRPVITTDIPGCRESVENEYTGWLCEPKSVDSLYEKMKAFLETDISKREVMGKYARQKWWTNLIKNRCKRYSKGFKTLIL